MRDATAKPVRIAIIAQNRLTCDSVTSALENDRSIPTAVCYRQWTAGDDSASETGHPSLADAAVILHHHQPDINRTLQSLRFLRDNIPDCPVCAVIPKFAPAFMNNHAQTLIGNGCQGLLTGDISIPELKTALATVRAGQYYLSAAARQALLDAARVTRLSMSLSQAEYRILSALIAAGAEKNEISGVARRLGLSTKTVYAHLYRIADRHNLPHNISRIVGYWSGKIA